MGEPVFPLEIFGRIIEIIDDETPLDERHLASGSPQGRMKNLERLSTLHSLQTCSLVSRAFAHLTRPGVFRTAVVGFIDNTASERQLHRLIQIINDKPHFAHHIRDLHLDLEGAGYYGPLMSHRGREEFSRCTNFIMNLPNVQSLSLYTTARTDEVTRFFHQMITAYTAKPSLRSLHLKKVLVIPFPAIFACTSLHTLSLDRCKWPVISAVVPHITALKLRKMAEAIPLSSLLYLPNLQHLIFERGGGFHSDSALVVRTAGDFKLHPPFGLITLSLPLSYGYAGLAGFYEQQAKEHATEPFASLTNLSTRLPFDSHYTMAGFRIMPSLQHLSLHCSGEVYRMDSESAFFTEFNHSFDVHLSTCGALIALPSLNLDFTSVISAVDHFQICDNLPQLFTNITQDNCLRHLTVKVYAPLTYHLKTAAGQRIGTENITSAEAQAWVNVALFLKNCAKFPKLQTLELQLHYCIVGRGYREQELNETAPVPPLPEYSMADCNSSPRFAWQVETNFGGSHKLEDVQMLERIHDLRKTLIDFDGNSPYFEAAGNIVHNCHVQVYEAVEVDIDRVAKLSFCRRNTA